MERRFPDYSANPCLTRLPGLHRLLLRLIRGGRYRTIQLLFRLKDRA